MNFAIGQYVVYPFQGVGKIADIQKREFNGAPSDYYVIRIDTLDMTISIPASSADSLGIRAIVGAEEAKKAIKHLSDKEASQSSDWKVRQQQNTELVRKGDIKSIAEVVQTLYRRSKDKELPVQERRLYDCALSLLTEEVSLALGMSENEASEMIMKGMEK